MKTALTKIHLALQEAGIKKPVDLFIPKRAYQELQFQLHAIQMNPQSYRGFDMGVVMFDQIKVKPVDYLNSLYAEIEKLNKRLEKVMEALG